MSIESAGEAATTPDCPYSHAQNPGCRCVLARGHREQSHLCPGNAQHTRHRFRLAWNRETPADLPPDFGNDPINDALRETMATETSLRRERDAAYDAIRDLVTAAAGHVRCRICMTMMSRHATTIRDAKRQVAASSTVARRSP